MWGTAGNLSLRINDKPLEIAITPSGLNKGHLTAADLLTLKDGAHSPKHPKNHVPSAETVIHQAVYRAVPNAGAVFHVHAIYATLISRYYGHPTKVKTFEMEWFEMMKGVGVGEEEASEIAVFPNWQDVSRVAQDITDYLKRTTKALPVVLIYNHGLTGWGATPDQARNHLEIMEYVCQYLYLKRLAR